MKKIILSGIMSAILTVNVFAAPAVGTKDAANDIITVSGSADAGQSVSLFVLNPGFDLAEINEAGAVQYFDRIYAGTDGYSFDVGIKNVPAGGQFTAIVNIDGAQEGTIFSFYPITVKLRYIDDVNASNTYEQLVARIRETDGVDADAIKNLYAAFSMENDPLFTGLTRESIGNALLTLKKYDADDDSEYELFERDADKMLHILKKALVLAAFNAGADELLISDGKLLYADILGLDSTDEHNDYLSNLSQDGINSVNDTMLNKQYKNINDINKTFCEELYYRVIVNYKESGWGHIAGYLDKYETYYRDKGFLLDKLNRVTSPAEFYTDLLDSSNDNISELKKAFNNLLNDSDDDDDSNRGGGGFSSGSGVTSAPNAGSSQLPPRIDQVFPDVANVQWAHEAITALRNVGAINGKTETSFAPHDSVTRGEFLKMMMIALDFEESNADIAFSDMADHWSKPYVAAAVEHKIANGVSDGHFAPDMQITREQGATFLYRAATEKLIALSGVSLVFTDESEIDSYAKDAVYKLSAAGVINGKGDGTFAPDAMMTRAEAAKLIYGIMQLQQNN